MKALLFAVLAVLTVVACGQRNAPEKPAAVTPFPAVACSTLTEAEVTQFLKVLPTFKAALKAGKWQAAPPGPDEGPGSSLASYVEGLNVPGMEESLRAAGSDWGTVRATLYKVFAASAALNVAAVSPADAEEMKRDTSEAGRMAFLSFQTYREACSPIPAANMEVVRIHQEVFAPLQTLGQ
ncbi:hypothetical protein JXD38_12270 [candidate division WOR-3 bacterium]|nr:hypothetical protein [candidate division WOR-3 bacterium]